MIVRHSQPWGSAAALPEGAPIAYNNTELRRLVTSQQVGSASRTPIGLAGGDLWRVVGAPTGGAERLRGNHARRAPIDLIEVTADGETYWACIGVVARKGWWRGPIVAAMNSEMLGNWRIAPAAHPNDGRLHVLCTGLDQAALSAAQRVLARRRLPSGTHLPHPAIAVQRVQRVEYRFDHPLTVWLDGERVGRFCALTLAILPDAVEIAY